MNKAAEIYYHLNDALTAIGRANAISRDVSVKCPTEVGVAMRDYLRKANQAIIDTQNLLTKCINIKVPENER